MIKSYFKILTILLIFFSKTFADINDNNPNYKRKINRWYITAMHCKGNWMTSPWGLNNIILEYRKFSEDQKLYLGIELFSLNHAIRGAQELYILESAYQFLIFGCTFGLKYTLGCKISNKKNLYLTAKLSNYQVTSILGFPTFPEFNLMFLDRNFKKMKYSWEIGIAAGDVIPINFFRFSFRRDLCFIDNGYMIYHYSNPNFMLLKRGLYYHYPNYNFGPSVGSYQYYPNVNFKCFVSVSFKFSFRIL